MNSIPCAHITRDKIEVTEHIFAFKEKRNINGTETDVTVHRVAEMEWMSRHSDGCSHFQTVNSIPVSAIAFHKDKDKLKLIAEKLQKFLIEVKS